MIVNSKLSTTEGLLTLFEPVRVVASFEDIAVMREPIEQGGGHLGIPQTSQNTLLFDPVVSDVTITDPAHPLFRQTLPVVRILAASTHESAVVVQLPTGEHRRVPRAATDLAVAADKTATVIAPLPISVRTLLPLAHNVRCLLAVRE